MTDKKLTLYRFTYKLKRSERKPADERFVTHSVLKGKASSSSSSSFNIHRFHHHLHDPYLLMESHSLELFFHRAVKIQKVISVTRRYFQRIMPVCSSGIYRRMMFIC